MGESARDELERVTTLVTGLEAAGHTVADLAVAVSPDTESTVTAHIPLVDPEALDELTLRIDDVQLTGNTLELTAVVADAHSTEGDSNDDTDGDETNPGTTDPSTVDQVSVTDTERSQPAASSDDDQPAAPHASGESTATEADNSESGTATQPDTGATTASAVSATDSDVAVTTTDTDTSATTADARSATSSDEAANTTTEASSSDGGVNPANADTVSDTASASGAADDKRHRTATAADTDTDPVSTEDGPVYRDPERLEAVYDPDATFPEMTAALGADVTPQTVRRYMIEYEIHEPASRGSLDTTDHNEDDTAAAASDTTTASTDTSEPSTNTDTESAETADGTDAADVSLSTDDTPASGDHETTAGDTTADTTATAAASDQRGNEDNAESTRSDVASAEQLTIADIRDRGGTLPLPDDVELDQLVAAVADSRTVYEVRKQLGLDDRQTRTVLKRCGLIDLVTGRITKGSSSPDRQVVIRRIIDAAGEIDSGDVSATTG